MKFQVLASGSKGNMTYIETAQTKILVDAGISYNKLIQKLDSQTSIDNLDAIFITHEHSDHIFFINSILNKTKATLYIHSVSFEYMTPRVKDKIDISRVKFIDSNKKYNLKDLSIYTLELSHYSMHCLGFLFESNNKRLAYITDTGFVPLVYLNVLKKIDCIIIEANHDIDMLIESERNQFLKNRILSQEGHISNLICRDILSTIVSENTKYIVLAHASAECNDDDLIIATIQEGLDAIYHERLIIAKQDESTILIKL